MPCCACRHCGADVAALEVDYRLLFDIDPQHKGLLQLRHGGSVSTAIFDPTARARRCAWTAMPRPLRQFGDYVRHGVWHIWIGFDHILFLLSLLLPAVLVYRDRQWLGRATFRAAAFIDVLKIVTAFTLAHSITLTLATLGVVTLPSRLVESAIAASVVLAALNNLWPLFHGRRALVAFGFCACSSAWYEDCAPSRRRRVHEAHLVGFFFEHLEHVRVHVAAHRQVASSTAPGTGRWSACRLCSRMSRITCRISSSVSPRPTMMPDLVTAFGYSALKSRSSFSECL
jgi:hypothetical protein